MGDIKIPYIKEVEVRETFEIYVAAAENYKEITDYVHGMPAADFWGTIEGNHGVPDEGIEEFSDVLVFDLLKV